MTSTFVPLSFRWEEMIRSWRQSIDGLTRAFDDVNIDIPMSTDGKKYRLPDVKVVADLSQAAFVERIAEAIGSSVEEIEKKTVEFQLGKIYFSDPFDERITYHIKTDGRKVNGLLEVRTSEKIKPVTLLTHESKIIAALDQYMDKEDMNIGPGYGASEDLILYENCDRAVKIRIIGTVAMCKSLDPKFKMLESDIQDIKTNPLYAW